MLFRSRHPEVAHQLLGGGCRELFDVEAAARSPNQINGQTHVGRVGEASCFRAHESAEYARREPEKTLLYQTVQRHWLQFLADVERTRVFTFAVACLPTAF